MKKISLLSGALVMLISGGQTYASGFYISEQGTRAAGMANAFTAIADDASALWYNPAGISFQPGINVMTGTNIIQPEQKFQDSSGTVYKTSKKTFVIPFLYTSYSSKNSPFSVGLGVNSPFGLSTDWSDSKAPFSSTTTPSLLAASVTFSEIRMKNINPTLAYRFNDKLSLALGITYYDVARINFNSQVLLQNGQGNGRGTNFGLLYKADNYSFGVSYRSKVKADITGTATGAADLALLGSSALVGATSTVATSITFPDILKVGVAFSPSEKWSFSSDIEWVNWTTYDKLVFSYGTSALNALTGSSGTVNNNWKAATMFRAGAQWIHNDTCKFAFGYVYDPTPVPNDTLTPRPPRNDRQLFTIGHESSLNKHSTFNIAYNYITLANRELTTSSVAFYNGVYTSDVHLFTLAYTYRQ